MAENSIDRAEVRLRRFPWPYRAMLAICSDIDHTRIDTFRSTHRFLNTIEKPRWDREWGRYRELLLDVQAGVLR